MKRLILAALATLALAGCSDASVYGAGWVTLPDDRGKVICASNGHGVSCDWDHAERTTKP